MRCAVHSALGMGLVSTSMGLPADAFPSASRRIDPDIERLAQLTGKDHALIADVAFGVASDVFSRIGRPANRAEVMAALGVAIAAKDAEVELRKEGKL